MAPNSIVHVEYKLTDEVFHGNTSDVNIIIALATTAMGQMKLNLKIHKLGHQICFCDTDSLIFLSGDYMSKLGDMIGDFKDETSCNDKIEVFESLGPKKIDMEMLNSMKSIKEKIFIITRKD